MNRDVVCSLWNRPSTVWAVQLTASNGVEHCEIDSTLIQWHRIREMIGSEPGVFYFKRRYSADSMYDIMAAREI